MPGSGPEAFAADFLCRPVKIANINRELAQKGTGRGHPFLPVSHLGNRRQSPLGLGEINVTFSNPDLLVKIILYATEVPQRIDGRRMPMGISDQTNLVATLCTTLRVAIEVQNLCETSIEDPRLLRLGTPYQSGSFFKWQCQ